MIPWRSPVGWFLDWVRCTMMKKLVLGYCLALILSGGACWGMNVGGARTSLRERSLSDSAFYNVVKEKYKWAIPKGLKAKTTDDIDKAIKPCIDAEFSLKNVQGLFERIVRNPSCSNYVRLVFDEYSLKSGDWRLAYVSSVLNYAAVCYDLRELFTLEFLNDLLQRNIEEDPWELKTVTIE